LEKGEAVFEHSKVTLPLRLLHDTQTPDDGEQQLFGLSRGNQSDTCKRQRDEKRAHARQMSLAGVAGDEGDEGQGFGFEPSRT